MGKEVSLTLNTISKCYPEPLLKSARLQSVHLETSFKNLSLQTFGCCTKCNCNWAVIQSLCPMQFHSSRLISCHPKLLKVFYSFMLSFPMGFHISHLHQEVNELGGGGRGQEAKHSAPPRKKYLHFNKKQQRQSN